MWFLSTHLSKDKSVILSTANICGNLSNTFWSFLAEMCLMLSNKGFQSSAPPSLVLLEFTFWGEGAKNCFTCNVIFLYLTPVILTISGSFALILYTLFDSVKASFISLYSNKILSSFHFHKVWINLITENNVFKFNNSNTR